MDIETVNFFFSSYGLLTFNDRFELIASEVSEAHREAALQEWFTHLRNALKPPETPKCPECGYIARACLGCGRTDC